MFYIFFTSFENFKTLLLIEYKLKQTDSKDCKVNKSSDKQFIEIESGEQINIVMNKNRIYKTKLFIITFGLNYWRRNLRIRKQIKY